MEQTRPNRPGRSEATDHLTDREATLWKAYRAAQARNDNLDAARNQLLEHYLPLVGAVAQQIAARVPGGTVTAEELAAEGVFGLLHAIASYEEDRGNQFSTHARHRVVGAMRDYLRSLDQAPRLVRSRQRALDSARAAFFARYGRRPSDEETRAQLNLEEKEFQRVLADGEYRGCYSLDAPRAGDHHRESDYRESLADEGAADPSREAVKKNLKELLNKGLSRAERLIVVLYFYEKMTMKEIGVTLGLSEARVSQMLTSILARLKARLFERENEFASVA